MVEDLEAQHASWELAAATASEEDRSRWLAHLRTAQRKLDYTISSMQVLLIGAADFRRCVVCDEMILAGRSDRRYCSGLCRLRGHRARRAARKEVETPPPHDVDAQPTAELSPPFSPELADAPKHPTEPY
jgi:hypothetical protein